MSICQGIHYQIKGLETNTLLSRIDYYYTVTIKIKVNNFHFLSSTRCNNFSKDTCKV